MRRRPTRVPRRSTPPGCRLARDTGNRAGFLRGRHPVRAFRARRSRGCATRGCTVGRRIRVHRDALQKVHIRHCALRAAVNQSSLRRPYFAEALGRVKGSLASLAAGAPLTRPARFRCVSNCRSDGNASIDVVEPDLGTILTLTMARRSGFVGFLNAAVRDTAPRGATGRNGSQTA
jgi:hypothetical protein